MKTIPLEEALPCRVLALLVLVLFYGIYFGKAMVQKRKGIQTRQIGHRKEKNIHTVELLMSAATLLAPAAQLLSLVLGWSCFPANARFTGFLLGLLGDGIFLTSVLTMRDSWRAGIPDRDKTELITSGIYAYSRNPAFLGFDLMYLGTFLLLGNWPLLRLRHPHPAPADFAGGALPGGRLRRALPPLPHPNRPLPGPKISSAPSFVPSVRSEAPARRPRPSSPARSAAPAPVPRPSSPARSAASFVLRPSSPPPQRPSRRQCRSAASRTAGTLNRSRHPTGAPVPRPQRAAKRPRPSWEKSRKEPKPLPGFRRQWRRKESESFFVTACT